MSVSITASVVPTGGAVLLDFTSNSLLTVHSPMTLQRALVTNGVAGPWATLYTGDAIPLFIDAGDGLPRPLTGDASYQYQVSDTTGSAVTGVLQPAGAIIIEPDGLTSLLIRLLQAGVSNITLPEGVKAANVSNAMPVTGFPQLPFVVVNLDLVQQEYVPLGQDVIDPDNNNVWTLTSYARRTWRVSVMTRTAAERDFYRDGLIAIFQSLCGSVFSAMGNNMNHRFQAASGQTADEYQGKSPGFYFADVMMEVLGTFNTAIQTSYGLIETIIINSNLPGGAVESSGTYSGWSADYSNPNNSGNTYYT